MLFYGNCWYTFGNYLLSYFNIFLFFQFKHLTKQSAALREVNDSRIRIYEQLEVSIQDLELANHRLTLENASNRKQIKNLTASIEAAETKCEDLQSTIDDLTRKLDNYKRKVQRAQEQSNPEVSRNSFNNVPKQSLAPISPLSLYPNVSTIDRIKLNQLISSWLRRQRAEEFLQYLTCVPPRANRRRRSKSQKNPTSPKLRIKIWNK